MQNLSSPETNLRRFIHELGDTAAITAPAAETQASLFDNLDTTMSALRVVARPYIQDSITKGAPALDAGIRNFPQQRPFLRNTEGLMRELRPGVKALRTAAPVLSDALGAGIRVLPNTPPLNNRLASLLEELQRFAEDPLVPRGIQATTQAVNALNPTLQYLAPTQTKCNYLTLWFRNISSLLSEGDRNGTWQRFIIVTTPQGPNSEGGAVLGAGQRPDDGQPRPPQPVPEHGRARPAAGVRGGQRAVPVGQDDHSNLPGTQSDHTEGS